MEVFLYDEDLEYPIASKPLPRLSPNCKVLSNGEEYNNSLPLQIQDIDSSKDCSLKFMIRIEEEVEKKFTLFFKYTFEKRDGAEPSKGPLSRDFVKKFAFQTLNPFHLKTRVKILNHYYNNIYKTENLGGKASPMLLPLSHRSNILYYLSPPCTFFRLIP